MRHTAATCRQTKLTAVLKDALGGNCATVMVANLWPEAAYVESSVSTLRFASRVRAIPTLPLQARTPASLGPLACVVGMNPFAAPHVGMQF